MLEILHFGNHLPFVYFPEAATAYRYVSTWEKKSCMSILPMQFCFVYRVSGSTEPLMTVPAGSAIASPAPSGRTPCCGERVQDRPDASSMFSDAPARAKLRGMMYQMTFERIRRRSVERLALSPGIEID